MRIHGGAGMAAQGLNSWGLFFESSLFANTTRDLLVFCVRGSLTKRYSVVACALKILIWNEVVVFFRCGR